MDNKKRWLVAAVGLAGLLAVCSASGAGKFAGGDATMEFPEHYREWVWLTSGLGMSYTATTESTDPNFDNVFVTPAAYRTFMETGTWPNGTVFVLEIRGSRNQGSINKAGHYQGELTAVEVHAKKADGTWAFYGFGNGRKPAKMIGHDASCYSCHEQHGAVDTTFVQFYPTLEKIAREKNVYSEKN